MAVSPQNPEAQPTRTGPPRPGLADLPAVFGCSELDDSAAEAGRRKKFPLRRKQALFSAPLPRDSRLKGAGAARSNCGKLDIVKEEMILEPECEESGRNPLRQVQGAPARLRKQSDGERSSVVPLTRMVPVGFRFKKKNSFRRKNIRFTTI